MSDVTSCFDCSSLRGVYSTPGVGSGTSAGKITDVRLRIFLLREGVRSSSPTGKTNAKVLEKALNVYVGIAKTLPKDVTV